ncbi:hypothetical protein [Bordetella genomosp. 13]|uniref:hypothetical protein n=1 Tax=Bordetella genomosp. 13 TaxID=463040 RepID=UPI0011A3505E|nr:hypothetical protein [Bordetella genomosp. 13]
MQKKIGPMLGAMMIVAMCQAQAGTAEQSEWNGARASAVALPCAGASQVAMATPVNDEAAGQSPHVYDTLERLVESGQIVNLRHTMTGADLWLAEPAGKPQCAPGSHARRGKCAS